MPSSDNIPGIFNYCDRWCERCVFNSRCAVSESERDIAPEERDIRNKAFWNRLSKNFTETLVLIQQAAEKHGVDLSITEEERREYSKQQEALRKAGRNHPISKLSWQYADEGRAWLEQSALKEKTDELIQHAALGLQSEQEVVRQAELLNECLNVIYWYLHFIHVKFMRALMGKFEDDGWELEHGFQRDFDGSAKIAMIAIDRSLQAWAKLFELMPDQEDVIISLLGKLQKLKALAEVEFPEAQAFIRPGFDEPQYQQ